jgi:hypothetical protein
MSAPEVQVKAGTGKAALQPSQLFESTEHVSCAQPFTYSHSIQESSLPAMSTLRPVNTGCSRDSSRKNIVGHDQGAHATTSSVISKHSV